MGRGRWALHTLSTRNRVLQYWASLPGVRPTKKAPLVQALCVQQPRPKKKERKVKKQAALRLNSFTVTVLVMLGGFGVLGFISLVVLSVVLAQAMFGQASGPTAIP